MRYQGTYTGTGTRTSTSDRTSTTATTNLCSINTVHRLTTVRTNTVKIYVPGYCAVSTSITRDVQVEAKFNPTN